MGAASVVPGAWVGAAVGAAVGTAVAAGAQAARTIASRVRIENKVKRFVRCMVLLLRRMVLADACCFADTMVRVLPKRLQMDAEAISGVC